MERRINFLFLAHSIRASACRYVERWWYVLSSSLPDWISITKTPFSYILISYPLKDEFSFFSASICWINKIIFFCTPRIGAKAPCTVGVGCAVTNCIDDGIRTPSKSLKSWPKQIVANIQKNCYLEVQHLIHFHYHYLLVASQIATLTSPMYKWRPLLHASCMCPVTSFRFSRLKMGCQNATKHAENLFVNNLQKFRKFIVSSISHLGDIKEVWYKDWKMSLYKPGQVRACFCWITEKSQIIQIEISFVNDNFCVDFFKDANFVMFIVDFFCVKFGHISWSYRN